MKSRYWPRNTTDTEVIVNINKKEIPCKAINFSSGGGVLLEVINNKNIDLKKKFISKNVSIKIGSDNNRVDYTGEILRVEKDGSKILIAVKY